MYIFIFIICKIYVLQFTPQWLALYTLYIVRLLWLFNKKLSPLQKIPRSALSMPTTRNASAHNHAVFPSRTAGMWSIPIIREGRELVNRSILIKSADAAVFHVYEYPFYS